MAWITLYLDRAPVGGDRKNAAAVAAQRQGRRKTQKLAGYDSLWSFDVRDNLLNRFAAAGDSQGHLGRE